jgi:D-alanyl-D-alanine carboxypeptidase/D-alanyl-D-alanine-endopeptidase (penicillin-binding protein 4)
MLESNLATGGARPQTQRAAVGPLLTRRRRYGGLFRGRGEALVLCLAFVLLCFPPVSYGMPPFNAQLDALIRRHVPQTCAVSVQVVDFETGRVLMEKNPDEPLVPASTMKVVTTAAALRTLRPDFTFVTQVFGDDVRGTSLGNIYLKGFGDPYLVSEQLFVLTRDVRDKGLQQVRGNIVVDDSYFIPDKPSTRMRNWGPGRTMPLTVRCH